MLPIKSDLIVNVSGFGLTQFFRQTHGLLGTAEALGALLCYLTTAAHSEPGLQAVDGLPTAAEVAGTKSREEAVWVSGPSLTMIANVREALSCGKHRWERYHRFFERVCFGLG